METGESRGHPRILDTCDVVVCHDIWSAGSTEIPGTDLFPIKCVCTIMSIQ